MKPTLSRPLTVAGVTVLALFAAPLSAGAHPYVTDGATAPAGSLTTITLALGHGCASEQAGDGAPTSAVSLEVPDAVSYLAAHDVDGYEVELEGDDERLPEVVTWTATDGGVPAPEFELDVVIDGEPGDELYLRVLQVCDDVEHRWVGTPDEPADEPAVGLTLTDHDPDAPAPPEPATDAEADAAPEDGQDVDAAPEAEASGDGEESDGDGDDTPTAVADLPTDPPEDEDGGGIGWLPVVLGALVLAGLGGLIGARRRPVVDPTAVDADGEPRDPTR